MSIRLVLSVAAGVIAAVVYVCARRQARLDGITRLDAMRAIVRS